jgi:DNA-directed RNA polymerase specialized sigma24 family protein
LLIEHSLLTARLGSVNQMDWKQIEPWEYIIVAVATEYHKKFNVVEYDDIKQSLYQWFPEHPNKLAEWEAIGPKDAKNLIYRSLRNQALDYCQRWKAKSLGYDVADLYYYETDVIEALLPSVLRDEWGVTHKLNLGRPGRPSAPAEGGNLQAMMIEIDSAYHKLSVDERRLLFLRYAESMDYSDLAKELDSGTPDATRMRCNRAVRKLVVKMGGYRPFLDEDTEQVVKEEPSELEQPDESGDENNWDTEHEEESE